MSVLERVKYGGKKMQGPTLGARFTEPGVRFMRVSIRKERVDCIGWAV